MTTNPLQASLAAIWDTAMGDGNGMAAAAALSQALTAAWGPAGIPGTGPGWVQDRALDLLLAPGSKPGVAWLAVASNTLGAMLREADSADPTVAELQAEAQRLCDEDRHYAEDDGGAR